MRQVKATVFRLTLTALTEPHEVTVHGVVIGEWIPRGQVSETTRTDVRPLVRRPTPDLTKRA